MLALVLLYLPDLHRIIMIRYIPEELHITKRVEEPVFVENPFTLAKLAAARQKSANTDRGTQDAGKAKGKEKVNSGGRNIPMANPDPGGYHDPDLQTK